MIWPRLGWVISLVHSYKMCLSFKLGFDVNHSVDYKMHIITLELLFLLLQNVTWSLNLWSWRSKWSSMEKSPNASPLSLCCAACLVAPHWRPSLSPLVSTVCPPVSQNPLKTGALRSGGRGRLGCLTPLPSPQGAWFEPQYQQTTCRHS